MGSAAQLENANKVGKIEEVKKENSPAKGVEVI
jgi:hypothetical protein